MTRERSRASRRVEEGLSRSFSGGGGKPSFPSPSAGDLRELPRVPLRGEGSCGGGGAPRDSAGSGATEEGLTSRGGRHLRLPLRFGLRPQGPCRVGTKGHIESRKAFAVDCTVDEAKDTQLEVPFKGNVDPKKLEKVLAENADLVPFIIVTVTNNTAGGQPVSMQNLREVRAIADKYGKRVIFDSARFVENAYFIRTREEGYADKTIKEICAEMFSYADGMTMSSKKDGLVNMGGFIATRHEDWYEGAKKFCIPFEGFLTYGGMNGRDMAALAVGLDENTELETIETRIRQVQYLAAKLDEYGIPYQRPVGGHAIFVDADKVLDQIPKEEFPAQTLAIELYIEAGVRGCEIGYILADRDPVTRENRFGGLDLLRLCIARRVYTNNHMDVIAAALKNVYDRRHEITRGVKIVWETELMRHFTVKLERL